MYIYYTNRQGFFVPDNDSAGTEIPLAEVVVDHENYPMSNNAFVEASRVQRMWKCVSCGEELRPISNGRRGKYDSDAPIHTFRDRAVFSRILITGECPGYTHSIPRQHWLDYFWQVCMDNLVKVTPDRRYESSWVRRQHLPNGKLVFHNTSAEILNKVQAQLNKEETSKRKTLEELLSVYVVFLLPSDFFLFGIFSDALS